MKYLYQLLLVSLISNLALSQSLFAAEKCASYLKVLDDYQKDRTELLNCGISANDFFMQTHLDKEKEWCQQANQIEVNQRVDQLGLTRLHCGGILHFFDIESDVKRSQHLGLINASHETLKLEPLPLEALNAIIASPGNKTGSHFSPFPIKDLQGVSPVCHLWGIQTAVSTDSTRTHWLTSAAPPCQRDEFNQSPFWLIEQKDDHYRVILAYRTDSILVKTERYQGYSSIETYHTLNNGNNDSVKMTWQYNPLEKQYRYVSSVCSNFSRVDDAEPAFITNCNKEEQW